MKILFIGGTGVISAEISRQLADQGHELYLINRGSKNELMGSRDVKYLVCDISDEEKAAKLITGLEFDVVADFIAYVPEQLERDYRLFKGKTRQFIFISSASAYQKPLSDYRINEGTPLSNPYWEYSRNKIACEEYLMKMYREEGFPVTIVRPSHTYNERKIPLGMHGKNGPWQVVARMKAGKPVIIHGDGTTLWTVTHARDFAKGFIGLMGNIHAIGEAVNITSDESLTWNQIYIAVADALGVELNAVYVSSQFLAKTGYMDFEGPLFGDKANTVVFDNSKLKRLVPGFNATIRFDQGIRETIEYIMARPELQTEDNEFEKWSDRVIAAIGRAENEVIKG